MPLETTRLVIGALVNINDAIIYLGGISRSNFYATILPELDVIKVGNRTMITADSLDEYIAKRAAVKKCRPNQNKS